MTLRKALLAASLLAFPIASMAQPIDGVYVSAGIGAAMLGTTNVGASTPFADGDHDADDLLSGVGGHQSAHGVGINGFASVGYGFGNGFRTEFELLGASVPTHLSGGGLSGNATNVTYGAMINGLYDFDINSSVKPYIGAGFGYTAIEQHSLHLTGSPGTFSGASGNQGSFAIQGIVGLAVPLAPQLDLTVDYRALDAVEDRTYGGVVVEGRESARVGLKFGNQLIHSINVGLRYAFGTAPVVTANNPAPIVQAAPAPARTYMVFFDWDKSNLTERAQQIIAEAARNSTKIGATRIDVAGHADKSGTPPYNQTLSLTRANMVAAELVRLGVPKSEIAISAFGDTKPLVPTAPGVREPQNRRVEIVLK